METDHFLPVKGTKPIPQTEAACHSPLVSLWFLSHEHIFPSSPLGGPLIASLDSLPPLAERPSLLFPAHSSLTPMSVLVSRPHPLLTTCPKLLAILVEIVNIKKQKTKSASCSDQLMFSREMSAQVLSVAQALQFVGQLGQAPNVHARRNKESLCHCAQNGDTN